MASPAPRIGMFGTFDLENFGDMVLARVTRQELLDRLPDAVVRVFTPLGYAGLNRFDDGDEVEPLGAWSVERARELADALDCVVVGGGEIIHEHDELLAPHYGLDPAELRERAPSRFFIDGLGPFEGRVPVLWNAVGIPDEPAPEQVDRFREALERRPYVAVRDEVSARRVAATGIVAEVVPDPGYLIGRAIPADVRGRRLEFLRSIRLFPKEGRPLVVQGNRDLVPRAGEIAEQVQAIRATMGDAPVVAIETGPCHGDDDFAAAFAQAFAGEVFVPGEAAGLADVAAAIEASAGFVGSSLHGNIAAFAFGLPGVVLDLDGRSKLETFAGLGRLARTTGEIAGVFAAAVRAGSTEETLHTFTKRIDEHFDRIAEIAVEAAWRRGGASVPAAAGLAVTDPVPDELEQLRTALEARGRRLVDERIHLADEMQELRTEIVRLNERLEVERDRVEDLAGQLAGTKRELEDLRNTATIRYTNRLRAIYGKVVMPFRLRAQRRRGEP